MSSGGGRFPSARLAATGPSSAGIECASPTKGIAFSVKKERKLACFLLAKPTL